MAENFCLRTVIGNFGCATAEAPPPPERQPTLIAGRGFYLDVRRVQNGQLEYYPAFEDVELLWDEAANTVSGDSEGVVEVEAARRRVRKIWRQTGFKDNDFVVLSYFTSYEDGGTTDPAGVGTYFLRARGSYWIGYIAIWDSENGIAFQCPYVLITGPSAAGTTIEGERWPTLYADAACAPIPLLNR